MRRLNAVERRASASQDVHAGRVLRIDAARYRRATAVENDQAAIDRVRASELVGDRVLMRILTDVDVRQRRDAARDDSNSITDDDVRIGSAVVAQFAVRHDNAAFGVDADSVVVDNVGVDDLRLAARIDAALDVVSDFRVRNRRVAGGSDADVVEFNRRILDGRVARVDAEFRVANGRGVRHKDVRVRRVDADLARLNDARVDGNRGDSRVARVDSDVGVLERNALNGQALIRRGRRRVIRGDGEDRVAFAAVDRNILRVRHDGVLVDVVTNGTGVDRHAVLNGNGGSVFERNDVRLTRAFRIGLEVLREVEGDRETVGGRVIAVADREGLRSLVGNGVRVVGPVEVYFDGFA